MLFGQFRYKVKARVDDTVKDGKKMGNFRTCASMVMNLAKSVLLRDVKGNAYTLRLFYTKRLKISL